MLDKRFILENVDLVQQNCNDRGVQADVARYVQLETAVPHACSRRSRSCRGRPTRSASRSARRRTTPSARPRKDEGRRLREQKDAKQAEHDRIAAEAGAIYRSLPNLTHPESPRGGEDASRELRRGAVQVVPMRFPVHDHVQLAEQHDLIDFEGGARVAGHGFYFLGTRRCCWSWRCSSTRSSCSVDEGFTPTITPDLARGEILQGIGFIPRGPETQIYSVENST